MPVPPTVEPTSSGGGSLSRAPWLNDPPLQRLMRVIAGADEQIRVVGGAVRDALMGRPVADIDLATTATPKIVMARCRHNDMRPVPTGIKHGTVTIIVAGKPYEVTTLREDVVTDGRHAIVKFGHDWRADALRRDFTVNALYATASGEIVDFVGGIADCTARRIRFIGDPFQRIREDYLRILRLFRFHASLCDGPIDPAGLTAATALRDGLKLLSGERVGQEMLKLVVADHAPAVLRIMLDTGILPLALDIETADVDRFSRLHAMITDLRSRAPAEIQVPAPLLLASLARVEPDDVVKIATRLRLPNAVRKRMIDAWTWRDRISHDMSKHDAHALIMRSNQQIFCDALLLKAAAEHGKWSTERVDALRDIAATFSPPALPISGVDLMAIGYVPGSLLGQTLDQLKQAWIDSEFTKTKADLLAEARHRDH